MLNTSQKFALILAEIVARDLSPNARQSFIQGLYSRIGTVDERRRADFLADLIDDFKLER